MIWLIVLYLFAIRSAWQLIWVSLAVRHFRVGDRPSPMYSEIPEGCWLSIIVPVFDEQNVYEPIKQLERLAGMGSNVRVIIVGTAAERRSAEGLNDTLEACRRHVSRVQVIECPEKETNRAIQVNWALRALSTPSDRSWVMQLDIDSIISDAVIADVVRSIQQGHDVIQVSAVFTKAITASGWLSKGHAVYQSRWTFAHEYQRFQMSRCALGFIYHVVSHGLTIRLSTLQSAGGLPTDVAVEDVPIGYVLSVRGEMVENVSHLEIADSPTTFRQSFAQLRRWANAPIDYLWQWRRIVRQSSTIEIRHRLLDARLRLLGLFSLADWNLMTWGLSAIGVTMFLHPLPHIRIVAALGLSLYLFQFLLTVAFLKRNSLAGSSSMPSLILAGFCHALWRSIPANVTLAQRLCRIPFVPVKARH
jgi:cellulose synthase/poly-beta-1,6-N-acetylglucosamine synthase-like glycosyltransferase